MAQKQLRSHSPPCCLSDLIFLLIANLHVGLEGINVELSVSNGSPELATPEQLVDIFRTTLSIPVGIAILCRLPVTAAAAAGVVGVEGKSEKALVSGGADKGDAEAGGSCAPSDGREGSAMTVTSAVMSAERDGTGQVDEALLRPSNTGAALPQQMDESLDRHHEVMVNHNYQHQRPDAVMVEEGGIAVSPTPPIQSPAMAAAVVEDEAVGGEAKDAASEEEEEAKKTIRTSTRRPSARTTKRKRN